MVAWSSDLVLAILAYGSMIVATLRAGSRALYLMEHDQIGVMDGPLILGPNDVTILQKGTATVEVSPLWELACVFQQSVRLALEPETMEYRILSVGTPHDDGELEKEPYSLSPFPRQKRNVVNVKVKEDFVVVHHHDESTSSITDDTDGLDIEILAEDIVSEKSLSRLAESPSFVSRLSVRGMMGKVPFVRRWSGQDDDASDDEESFSFEDLEFDGTYYIINMVKVHAAYCSLCVPVACFRMGL